MLKDEQIKIGNKFRGLINGCFLEIVGFDTGFKNKKIVQFKDIKTNEIYQTNYETAKRLLLEEVE